MPHKGIRTLENWWYGPAVMAKVDAKNTASESMVESGWGAYKLLGVGIVTLGIALAIIVSMGARLGGCMYLDGSH